MSLKSFILSFLFVITNKFAFSQIKVNNSLHDFGTIEWFQNDTAWFEISNNSDKKIYLLPTNYNENFQILVETKTFLPGETYKIGIVYFTNQKGNFSENIPIYFSHTDKAINFQIKGKIKNISPNAFNTCPSIENSKPLRNSVPLSIIVKDKETGEFLTKSEVKASKKRSENFICQKSANLNFFTCNLSYGEYLVTANHIGYNSQSEEIIFHKDAHTFIIYLEKNKDTIVENKFEDDEYNPTVLKDSLKEKSRFSRDSLFSKINFKKKGKDSIISYESFKPNHLIFVIDVSGSMKDSTKLPYLITSIKTMVSLLRPEDFITLIVFSSRPKIIFENISCSQTETIFNALDTLKSKGYSHGQTAITLAYDLAQKHYIANGNNQIFFVSDGVINGKSFNEQELLLKIKKENMVKEIKMSCILFGNSEDAVTLMQNMANKGGGHYLQILRMPEDEMILIEEVKKQSYISR